MAPALPSVLAADPWTPPRTRAVLSLTPIEHESIEWEPGERERYLAPRAGDAAPDQREQRRAQEREMFGLGGIIPSGAGRHLALEDLLALAEGGLREEYVRHYDLLGVQLARHGSDAIPTLLELLAFWPGAVLDQLRRANSTRVARFLLGKRELELWAYSQTEALGLLLVPDLFGPDGAPRSAALGVLGRFWGACQQEALRRAAARYGPAAVEEFDALHAPPTLPPRAPRLAAFAQPEKLPALALSDGTPVPADATRRLLQLATLLTADCARAARAAIDSAVPALDRSKLSDLADALLQAWLALDGPTKEKWVVHAAAIFGDDRAVRALAQKVEEWHAAKLAQRVKVGLKALAANGSDVALMHLAFLTRKKSPLRKKAQAELDAFRDAHGLSEDALAERLVPDLGLDAQGTLVFDYGPRSFRAGFDETLSPFVVDHAGARAASLPRPAKTDDPTKAARARELWDALKKETKGLAAEQLRRLERAMVARRQWDRAQFDRYFLKHPLMQHVARRLVWGVVDPARGAAATGFRIAEDGTFAGPDDAPFPLPDAARVVVWHPLDMPGEARARFAQLFTDYVIVQPFPQMARELFVPTDEERRASKTERWKGAKARGERFFTLKHRGWRFLDYEISKAVVAEADPSASVEATLDSEPGLAFLASKPEDQTLEALSLRDASGKERTFGELTPISVSELFRDVELLLR